MALCEEKSVIPLFLAVQWLLRIDWSVGWFNQNIIQIFRLRVLFSCISLTNSRLQWPFILSSPVLHSCVRVHVHIPTGENIIPSYWYEHGNRLFRMLWCHMNTTSQKCSAVYVEKLWKVVLDAERVEGIVAYWSCHIWFLEWAGPFHVEFTGSLCAWEGLSWVLWFHWSLKTHDTSS